MDVSRFCDSCGDDPDFWVLVDGNGGRWGIDEAYMRHTWGVDEPPELEFRVTKEIQKEPRVQKERTKERKEKKRKEKEKKNK